MEFSGEEDLEDTLRNASTDHYDSVSTLLDDSLPDASSDQSFDSEDLSLPDASLDTSDSSLVDLELGHSHSNTSRSCEAASSTKENSQVAARAEQNRKRRGLPLPLHYSTPKRASSNSSMVDSAKERKGIDDSASSQHTNSSSMTEDDILKQQEWKLSNILQYSGCSSNCAKEVHGLNEYEILSAHSHVTSLSNHDKNIWLLQYFFLQCPRNADGEKELKRMHYLIHGKEVCFDLWLEILSLSGARYYRIRKDFLANDVVRYTTKPIRSQQPKTKKAIAWMESYFQRVGDKPPDKNWVYLPTCLTLGKLYEMMTDQLCEGDCSKCISYPKFCQIYKDEFKNVSIPKHCRFSKCDLCTLIKAEINKPNSDKFNKQALEKLQKDHLSLQEQERTRYYMNCELAKSNPTEYISMIVDGMDQNKTNIPSLVRMTKSCQNLWTLRTHLTGVLVHGAGSYCYYDYLQWPHDCNLTIFTILMTLSEISKKRTLPPKLLIQMDNCVRENKNKYIFGFFSQLVQLEIFKEVELGFLMVGHTHEDVDQHFSCLSRYLQKNSVVTVEDLIQATKVSNQCVIGVQVLNYLFDIREWISPHLDQIRYHTEPHIFKFAKNQRG